MNFMNQFEYDKMSWVLFLELSQTKVNKKEKAKDFNQRFINLLNQILDNLSEFVQIEFYTPTLPPLVTMSIK